MKHAKRVNNLLPATGKGENDVQIYAELATSMACVMMARPKPSLGTASELLVVTDLNTVNFYSVLRSDNEFNQLLTHVMDTNFKDELVLRDAERILKTGGEFYTEAECAHAFVVQRIMTSPFNSMFTATGVATNTHARKVANVMQELKNVRERIINVEVWPGDIGRLFERVETMVGLEPFGEPKNALLYLEPPHHRDGQRESAAGSSMYYAETDAWNSVLLDRVDHSRNAVAIIGVRGALYEQYLNRYLNQWDKTAITRPNRAFDGPKNIKDGHEFLWRNAKCMELVGGTAMDY